MTWLTVMVFHNHIPVLFSFVIYNKGNTIGATSVAVTAYPSGEHEIKCWCGVHVAQSLALCVVFLFALFSV
jgi:hypothetical protein